MEVYRGVRGVRFIVIGFVDVFSAGVSAYGPVREPGVSGRGLSRCANGTSTGDTPQPRRSADHHDGHRGRRRAAASGWRNWNGKPPTLPSSSCASTALDQENWGADCVRPDVSCEALST